jgi:uncharacterized LabA/DUF88 family protein
MNRTVLYIDGENLRHYIEKVLREKNIPEKDAILLNIDLLKLLNKVLKGIKVSKKIYYSAKLKLHKETIRKSKELIQKQRVLKTKLEKQGFDFVMSGNVRLQRIVINKKSKIVFKEKGVDVRIAVDLVTAACDKKIKTAIICSSDSDLQPAITEIKNRGIKVIYLGFEIKPNKGLMYTANRAILIRNSEVLEFFNKKK